MSQALHKVLVANRGEIAARIMRTLRRRGTTSVAVYSEADRDAPFVRLADDAVCVGGAAPSESYLNTSAIIKAAKATGATAIHPGYGFLSENADFATAVAEAGLTFIGPSAQVITDMGDKAAAKQKAAAAGVSVVPGAEGDLDDDGWVQAGASIGYPLLVKAVAGGGGRGMRRVDAPADLLDAIASARREALSSFADDAVLLEKFVASGRHVEVQVFGDTHGSVVHLGERDCSTQRRRQKVLEEAPAPGLAPKTRTALLDDAVRLAKAIGYVGAGTVEFIVDDDGQHYFLEMNTRLQVEHPATEEVYGVDLVEWQLQVAEGAALPAEQQDLVVNGHAIEARLYAEDVAADFAPQTGVVHVLDDGALQGLAGIRLEWGVRSGSVVTPHYDAMVGKLIAHGQDRAEATRRLQVALQKLVWMGPTCNQRFLIDILQSSSWRDGSIRTRTLDDGGLELPASTVDDVWWWAAALAGSGVSLHGSWSSTGARAHHLRLQCGNDERRLTFQHGDDGWKSTCLAGAVTNVVRTSTTLSFDIDGRRWSWTHHDDGQQLFLARGGTTAVFRRIRAGGVDAEDADAMGSPVAGRVVLVDAKAGDTILDGHVVVVVEAMKMEHRICAPRDGTVEDVSVAVGQQVEAGDDVARLVSEG